MQSVVRVARRRATRLSKTSQGRDLGAVGAVLEQGAAGGLSRGVDRAVGDVGPGVINGCLTAGGVAPVH